MRGIESSGSGKGGAAPAVSPAAAAVNSSIRSNSRKALERGPLDAHRFACPAASPQSKKCSNSRAVCNVVEPVFGSRAARAGARTRLRGTYEPVVRNALRRPLGVRTVQGKRCRRGSSVFAPSDLSASRATSLNPPFRPPFPWKGGYARSSGRMPAYGFTEYLRCSSDHGLGISKSHTDVQPARDSPLAEYEFEAVA